MPKESAPPALLREAQRLLAEGDAGQAEALFAPLLRAPEEALDGAGWLQAGTLAGRLGRLGEAVALLERAVRRGPRLAEAWRTLGGALALAGREGEAAAAFRRALALEPEHPTALRGLARILERREGPAAALGCWERLAGLAPADLEARLGAARCLEAVADPAGARRHLEQAVRHHPGAWQARWALAQRFLHDMEPEAALAELAAAEAAAPADPSVRAALAADRILALERAGRLEEARRGLAEALARHRGRCAPVLAVARERVAQHGGPTELEEARAHAEELLARCELPAAARELLHFALGRLLDRLDRPEEAFRHFTAANRLQPRRFDPRAHEALLERVLGLFAERAWGDLPRAPGEPGRGLVLVVGMPRSGTSLVERILAAHPLVRAGGERQALGRLGLELLQGLPPGASLAQALDGARCAALGAAYWAGEPRPPAGHHVTDKMPTNFWWLGLAGLILPGARVVHCRRHPLDTLLSCYMQDFREGPAFTQRLEDLALCYRGYRRLMARWARLRPLPLLELDYEALVEDPEAQVRRLLDFLELPWDEACLRFHQAPGRTATASYDQVRRPLYRDAVGRWRRYARQLEPLRRALAELLPPGEASAQGAGP